MGVTWRVPDGWVMGNDGAGAGWMGDGSDVAGTGWMRG